MCAHGGRRGGGTYIDQLDAVVGDGGQSLGHILQHLVPVAGAMVPRERLAVLQALDQLAQDAAVAQVFREVRHPVGGRHVLVHPVPKRVRLYVHPLVLVALDLHRLGGVAFRAAGHQPDVGR